MESLRSVSGGGASVASVGTEVDAARGSDTGDALEGDGDGIVPEAAAASAAATVSDAATISEEDDAISSAEPQPKPAPSAPPPDLSAERTGADVETGVSAEAASTTT